MHSKLSKIVLGLATISLISLTAKADFDIVWQTIQKAATFKSNPIKMDMSKIAPNGNINKAFAAESARSILEGLKGYFGLEGYSFTHEDFPLKSASVFLTGDTKTLSVKLRQNYKRMPVHGSETIVTINIQSGELLGVTTSLLPLKDNLEKVPLVPTISKSQAYSILQNQTIKETGATFKIPLQPTLKIVFLNKKLSLAWVFETPANEKFYKVDVIIDAQSGELLSFFQDRPVILVKDGSSTGTQRDASMQVFKESPTLFKNNQISLSAMSPITTEKAGEAANITYKNMLFTYNHYLTKFKRKSLDGNGLPLNVLTNTAAYDPKSPNARNAFYGGPFFMFGAGSKGFLDLGRALDVVAHEYTHGVIDFTSNLEYRGQSGAANESFADIFGFFVEAEYNKKNNIPVNYFIGENMLDREYVIKFKNGNTLALKNLAGLRRLDDPTKNVFPSAQYDHMSKIPLKLGQHCKPSDENDYCGVHALNAVLNKAAYLIISKLGIEESEPIFYKTMTEKLKSNSDFNDVKIQMLVSCKEIYSQRPEIAKQNCSIIKNAYEAVGIL